MIVVNCHTNLDLYGESWPTMLPCVPHVGDEIESETVHKGGFHLKLQVVKITWRKVSSGWIPYIELHMTNIQKSIPSKNRGAMDGSITAFYEWYAPLVGQSVGSFI